MLDGALHERSSSFGKVALTERVDGALGRPAGAKEITAVAALPEAS